MTIQSQLPADITDLHTKFKVYDAVNKLSPETLKDFLQFRIGCLQEELQELKDADNADDAVDALIDLIYFAIGTLDLYKVDTDLSWYRVHAKNMEKEVGIKPGRANPYGLPDLVKPVGFVPPSHEGNHGLFTQVYGK